MKILCNILILSFFVPMLFVGSIFLRYFFRYNKKTFIGISEIASNIHSIQDCLDYFDTETTALIRTNGFSGYDENPKLSNKSTRKYIVYSSSSLFSKKFQLRFIQPIVKCIYFFRFLPTHNVWFFVWNETFLPFNMDLILLKLARKDVIMMHCGDDVRYRPIQKEIDSLYGIKIWGEEKRNIRKLIKKLYFVRLSEIVGKVISTRDQSTFQSVPYAFFRFPMESPDNSTILRSANSKPVIVHAPTCRYVKKTSVVLEAIQQLEEEDFEFKFILIENKSNRYILKTLKKADILVDQPGTWVGRLAVEACQAKCAVVGGNKSEYYSIFKSPVIQFDPSADSLLEILKSLLSSKKYLNNKKSECYKFWNDYYSRDSFFEFYKSILNDSSAMFDPLPHQKDILLLASGNIFEKLVIYLFYNPSSS
jgi:hypothetical protein